MSPFVRIKSRGVFTYAIIFFTFYIYIYNPIFVMVGMGLIKVLLLLSLIYSFKNRRKVSLYLNDYKNIIHLIVFAIIYCGLIIFFNSGNANTPYTMFIWLLESTFIPIFLINKLFIKYKLSLLNVLIPISLTAAFISLFLLVNPSLNEFILGGVIEIPYENNYGTWERCFGIAEGLTNSYGVIQGIFASICLLKGRTCYKYYFAALIIGISVIINARTGMIPIIITFLYISFVNFKKLQIKYFVILGVFVLLLSSILGKYGEDYIETIKYASSFFTSSFDFFIKGETGDDYYSALDRFIHFPDSVFGVVFGEGVTMFGDKNTSSDIGYVNQIYTGGIVYLLCLLVLQCTIYKKLLKRYKDRFFIFLLFATALIINFKGITFCISESFTRFVMLFYFILLHNKLFPKNAIKIGL